MIVASLGRLCKFYTPQSDGERVFRPRGLKDCLRRPHVSHLSPLTFAAIGKLLPRCAAGFTPQLTASGDSSTAAAATTAEGETDAQRALRFEMVPNLLRILRLNL